MNIKIYHNIKISKLQSKKAFTLIELITVVAIMLIMLTIVLSQSLNGKKAQKDVEAAARQVASQLRALQNDALNGKQAGTPLKSVCSFTFKVAAVGDATYTTKISACDGSGDIGSAQTFDLGPKGKVVANNTSNFYFIAPQGTISTGSATVKLKSKDGSAGYEVCVYSSGNVIEKKCSAASCTPSSC